MRPRNLRIPKKQFPINKPAAESARPLTYPKNRTAGPKSSSRPPVSSILIETRAAPHQNLVPRSTTQITRSLSLSLCCGAGGSRLPAYPLVHSPAQRPQGVQSLPSMRRQRSRDLQGECTTTQVCYSAAAAFRPQYILRPQKDTHHDSYPAAETASPAAPDSSQRLKLIQTHPTIPILVESVQTASETDAAGSALTIAGDCARNHRNNAQKVENFKRKCPLI